jgi:cytochrome c553
LSCDYEVVRKRTYKRLGIILLAGTLLVLTATISWAKSTQTMVTTKPKSHSASGYSSSTSCLYCHKQKSTRSTFSAQSRPRMTFSAANFQAQGTTELKVIVRVGTSKRNKESRNSSNRFIFFRDEYAPAGRPGEFNRIFVYVLNEHGTPVTPDSITVTVDGNPVSVSQKTEGFYTGRFIINEDTPSGLHTVTAQATLGALIASDSETFKIENWGCIDCHGAADPNSGVPTDWLYEGCTGCHQGAEYNSWDIDYGYVPGGPWPEHGVYINNSVVHPHEQKAHIDPANNVTCTSCHLNYVPGVSGGAHTTLSCTNCHGSLGLPEESGGEGSYETTGTIGKYIYGFPSGQGLIQTYSVNVAAGATSLQLTLNWVNSSTDLDVYVYDPSGKLQDYNLYGGATAGKPETVNIPNPAAGTWLIKVNYYEGLGLAGWPDHTAGDPLEKTPPAGVESFTLQSNYPIADADIKIPSNCSQSGCHSTPQWDESGTAFSHKYTSDSGQGHVQCRFCHGEFHAIKSLSDFRCQDCHQKPPVERYDTGQPITHPIQEPTFSNQTYDQCLGCHADPHDLSWAATIPDHRQTAACESCHSSIGWISPHGSYSTTSNRCKTCHAVHLAVGAYKLLVADQPDDACNYCHVGDEKHSPIGAYFGDGSNIYTRNGHTIGSGKTIPDSSVSQWLEEKTIVGQDGESITIYVRKYDPKPNKLFKVTLSEDGKIARLGPTYLYCMNCHQVHRADKLIWKPNYLYPNGYKLLRNSPSGSWKDANANENYLSTSAGATTWRWGEMGGEAPFIKVVENTLSASTTGWPKTLYTAWKGPETTITAATLSVWCADCHNLNIGYFENVGGGFGTNKYHSDRTHTVPYVTNQGKIDCYTCHRADMGDQYYAENYPSVRGASDFPHAAASNSTKLLGNDYTVGNGSSWDPVGNEHLDQICLRCHSEIGVSR